MNADAFLPTPESTIDQLNKKAWETRVTDSNNALALSQEAINLARSINYTKGLAEGLRTLGICHIRISKHEEAIHYLNEALPLCQSINDLYGESDIYAYYGAIHRVLGDYASSLDFLFKAHAIHQHLDDDERKSLGLYHIGVTYKYLGNYDQALNYLLQSLSIARAGNHIMPESYSVNQIGVIYYETGDYTNALSYYEQSLELRRKVGDQWGEAGCLDNIGLIHFKKSAFDPAKDFCQQAFSISKAIGDKKGQCNSLFHLASIYKGLGDNAGASECSNESLQIRRQIGDKKGESEVLLFLAESSIDEGPMERCLDLLDAALKLGKEVNANDLLSKIHFGFYKVYKHFNQHEKALASLEDYIHLEKTLNAEAVSQKILNMEISQSAEKSRKDAEAYLHRNIELTNLNDEIKRQKEEIEVQKKNTEDALLELKSTQAQLIQSAKMASLGELTTGIAHEIQNPLNFVNNFSEVNEELLRELYAEAEMGNLGEVKSIAKDLKLNSEKINHHGTRAAAIVKGMLQHSRTGSGQAEPTDVNSLAEEYSRLACHGLKAKDKDFNVKVETDFDSSIDKINIIPQEIGRVILNLINNAFYAVNEKHTSSPRQARDSAGQPYEPKVTVSTKKVNARPGDPRLNDSVGQAVGRDKVEIRVTDNGIGIPGKILDKIFQPFFTTKPTGQGTGLGLSLSYDIVKAHGGEIKVETKIGEGSTFIIELLA